MIIDIPGTDLELDDMGEYVVLKEKSDDGYYARFVFKQDELLAVSSMLLGLHIIHALKTQGEAQ